MAYYDFALRIGWFLGVEPDRVYLQQGSLSGLRIIQNSQNRKFSIVALNSGAFRMDFKHLPAEMHDLTTVQAENVLCIYKDEFKRIAP